MSTIYFNLAGGNFSQNWTDASLITTNDDWTNVPSITGYLGDIDAGSPTAVDPRTLTGVNLGAVDVIANQTSAGLSNGGVAEFDLADDTVALQGSGTADAPSLVLYLNAAGRQNLVLSFNARDIDGSGDNAAQQLNVQYRIGGSGAWTNAPGGYFADVTAGPGQATLVTPVSLALPSDVNGQAQVEIRIMTTNAASNDEWVGIDDILVTSDPGAGITVSIGDVSIAEGDSGTQVATFTVTRSSNTEAFAVDYATADGSADASDYMAVSGTVSFAAGGALTETISVVINGDTAIESDETFTVTLSNLIGPANVAIGDGQAAGTIVNDDPIAIYDIQGAGHASALIGQSVLTRGVVTMVGPNGFYIQDPTGDGNAATSDAIFVFTGAAPAAGIVAGKSVSVSGTVTEFLPGAGGLTVTEIVSPTVTVLGDASLVPTATLIGDGGRLPPLANIEDDAFGSFDPLTDGIDFYESLEGMLVGLEGAVSVSPTAHFGSSEEIWVTTVTDAVSGNSLGGVTIAPGDFNPQRVQIDDLFSSLSLPDVHVGATFGSISGVVSYSFSNYEVLVNEAPGHVASAIERETTSIAANPKTLTFGSMNVENLDANDLQDKFDGLAAQIVDNLASPTIVALQEMQDNNGATNDGTTDASLSAQRLIDAIAAAGGPAYVYVDIPPANNSSGGEPGGNIRPGFLYRADIVTLVPGSLTTLDLPAFDGSRDPLVARFMFNGEQITFINNHFSSKGGDNPLFGSTQPPVLNSETGRILQAQAVNDYVDGLLLGDPNANIVVLGDLNDFSWSTPLQTLDGSIDGGRQILFDLADETIADPAERFSYVFEGNSQELDHMYLSQGALDLLGGFDIVHVNAAFFDQVSDHDPSVASLVINRAPVAANDSGFTVERGRSLTIAIADLLGNDSDPDGDPLALLSVQSPVNGSVAIQGSNVVFTAVNHGGTGSFAYTIGDGDGGTATASVSIAIDPYRTIEGTGRGDFLWGTNGQDHMLGLGGNDFIYAAGASDILDGGAGDDALFGAKGDDVLIGGAGADWLFDIFGNNRFDGGAGNDELMSSSWFGRDIFVFRAGYGRDSIAGFGRNDVVELDSSLADSFADVLAHASKWKGGTLLTFDARTTLMIDGVKPGELRADDFAFV